MRSFLLVVLGVTLAACGSNPPAPDEALIRGEVYLEEAEYEGASEYTPAQLLRAQERINAARAAYLLQIEEEFEEDDEEYHIAKRHAREAEVDAKLAHASARSSQAEIATEEFHRTVEIMQSEIQSMAEIQLEGAE